MFSAVQNRPIANGRSPEITSTTVPLMPAAFSLNFFVEVWHTGVSRLGTMLSTFFLPGKSFSETSFKSLPVSVKSAARSPFLGKLPFTVMGLPPKVTFATWVLQGLLSCVGTG